MSLPADRLQLLYDVAHSVTTFTDLDPLLRHATQRVRELLGAEGCAVLLLDEERRRLFFPVASQAASREPTSGALDEISFPSHVGVAGWVLHQDRPALVEDTSIDKSKTPPVVNLLAPRDPLDFWPRAQEESDDSCTRVEDAACRRRCGPRLRPPAGASVGRAGRRPRRRSADLHRSGG